MSWWLFREKPPADPKPLPINIVVDADLFKSWIYALSSIVVECRVHFEPDVIRVTAVDTANVALVRTSITKSALKNYVGEPREFGLDVNKVKEIVEALYRESLWKGYIALGVEGKRLLISGNGFAIDIEELDPNSIRRDPSQPTIELTTDAVIDGSAFHRACVMAAVFSDGIVLKTVECGGPVFAIAKGDKSSFKADLGGKVNHKCMARSKFSLDSLRDFAKCVTGQPVTVQLGNDHPAIFTWKPFEGAEYQFLIAPRIESEDDPESDP